MSATIESIAASALSLPAEDRASLVDRLIASLDIDPRIETAWTLEIERRAADIESGAVALLPGDEALEQLRSQFQ